MISLQLAKSQREGIRCGAGAHTPCPVPSVSPDVPQCPNCLKRSLSPTKVTLLPQAQRTFEQPRAPGRHRENRAALAGPALPKSKQDKGRCTHSRLSHPAWLPCCMPQVVLAWLHQAENLLVHPRSPSPVGHSAVLVEVMVSDRLKTGNHRAWTCLVGELHLFVGVCMRGKSFLTKVGSLACQKK